MRIPVYILPTQRHGSNHLKRLFERNRMFKIIKFPCKKRGTVGITDAVTETNQVICALKNVHKKFPDDFCIVIKDTSVTNSTIDEIAKIILTAIDINKNNRHCKKSDWQLCYLCKWLDRCDLYKEEAKIKGVTKVVKTFSPFGIQAIMFSPDGRDIVIGKEKMNNGKFFTPIRLPLGDQLNENIGLGNINATAIVPNLFNFDVLIATNDADLLKLSECRQPDEIESFNPGPIPFLWFVAIVIGVILLAWFFYQFAGKEKIPSGTQEIKPVKRVG